MKEQWKHGDILKQKGSTPNGAGPLLYAYIHGDKSSKTSPFRRFDLSQCAGCIHLSLHGLAHIDDRLHVGGLREF